MTTQGIQAHCCVANRREVNGFQYAIRFHTDDGMASNADHQVNVKFEEWLNKKYSEHAPMQEVREDIHEHLGTTWAFRRKAK